MRFRCLFMSILLSVSFFPNVTAIRVYQVDFDCMPGKMLTTNSEGGGIFEEKVQSQTDFLEDGLCDENKYGFCGLFTGYGIPMKKWKNNLVGYYREKFNGSSFEKWFVGNKLDQQLEPVALRNKVKKVCQLLLNGTGSYGLRDMCNKIGVVHRDYKNQAEKIGSSVSASFVRFSNKDLFVGAIGDDSIAIFHGISGRGIGLPSESSYEVLKSVKNEVGCAGIGEINFNANKCAVEHIPLNPDGKYFIVLMNKAVRAALTDQEIAQIFTMESDNFERLAKRVSHVIVNKANKMYESMRRCWLNKTNRHLLMMPELAVKVIIINEPFYNFDGPNQKQKEKEEFEALLKDHEKKKAYELLQNKKARSLLKEYAQEINDEIIDNLYNRIIDEYPEHRVEIEKSGWWDTLHPYVINKYTLGSLFATLIGYTVIYTNCLKSFSSE